mmetsp:Transcript_60732/g.175138  ORF Transcript_60732/g.175138 Transcript_60732/m.175138 type:complete len:165 (+) Transcript_60732:482-976(+)
MTHLAVDPVRLESATAGGLGKWTQRITSQIDDAEDTHPGSTHQEKWSQNVIDGVTNNGNASNHDAQNQSKLSSHIKLTSLTDFAILKVILQLRDIITCDFFQDPIGSSANFGNIHQGFVTRRRGLDVNDASPRSNGRTGSYRRVWSESLGMIETNDRKIGQSQS